MRTGDAPRHPFGAAGVAARAEYACENDSSERPAGAQAANIYGTSMLGC